MKHPTENRTLFIPSMRRPMIWAKFDDVCAMRFRVSILYQKSIILHDFTL